MRQVITLVQDRFAPDITRMSSHLSGLFTRTEGTLPKVERLTEIDTDTASDLKWDLERLTGYAAIADLSLSRTFARWQDDRGRRNSRNITAHMTSRGIDTNSVPFQHWMARWMAAFTPLEGQYRIAWDAAAFDALGQVEGVDADRSCYAPGGAWFDAPATLLSGLFAGLHCFTVFLVAKGETVARCWGIALAGGVFILSNGYAASTGMQKRLGVNVDPSLSTFVRALSDATGMTFASRRFQGDREAMPVYVNGDTLLLWPDGTQEPRHDSLPLDTRREDCVMCDAPTCDSHGYQHPLCEDCRTGRMSMCEGCGTRMREAEESHGCALCDPDGSLILCYGCYHDRHPGCANCPDRVCRMGGAVRPVQHGYRDWNTGRTRAYPETWCLPCIGRAASVCFCGTAWAGCLTAHNCILCGTAPGL